VRTTEEVPVPDGFRINKRGLDKFTRELNKELQRSAKRNIKPVPVSTDDGAGRPGWSIPPAQPTTVVNGPTFYGDVTGQVAWDNSGPVHQHQHLPSGLTPTEVADLADLAHELLTTLAEAPDGDEEVSVATAEARAAAAALWAEAQQAEPDSGRIATMTARLRTALPGLASGIVSSSLVTAVSQLPW
jgi:hypothetical protein